jgi:hypothetical protein
MSFMEIKLELRFFESAESFLVFGEVVVFWHYEGSFEFLDKGVEDLFYML